MTDRHEKKSSSRAEPGRCLEAAPGKTKPALRQQKVQKARTATKVRLQVVPLSELPLDEQELLAAYRTMDDRARSLTLAGAVRRAESWPAPVEREPLRLIVGGRA